MEWHYMFNGEPKGPCSAEDIKILLLHCKLSKESLVWNPSMGAIWQKIADIPELSEHGHLALTEKDTPPVPQPKSADPEELAALDPRTTGRATLLLENMMTKNTLRQAIIDELIHRKVPEGAAKQIVKEAFAARDCQYRKKGLQSITWGVGAAILLLGTASFTYSFTGRLYIGKIFFSSLLLSYIMLLNGVGRLLFGATTKYAWIPTALGVMVAALGYLQYTGKIF